MASTTASPRLVQRIGLKKKRYRAIHAHEIDPVFESHADFIVEKPREVGRRHRGEGCGLGDRNRTVVFQPIRKQPFQGDMPFECAPIDPIVLEVRIVSPDLELILGKISQIAVHDVLLIRIGRYAGYTPRF